MEMMADNQVLNELLELRRRVDEAVARNRGAQIFQRAEQTQAGKWLAAQIVAMCEQAFGLREGSILLKRRTEQLVKARCAAMWLARNFTAESSTELGELFGLDHSTVLYGVQSCKERMECYPAYKRVVEELAEAVQRLANDELARN